MINRLFFRTASGYPRLRPARPSPWAMIVCDTVTGFRTAAHHALMIVGITAIAALGIMFVEPALADHLKLLSPFSKAITPQTAAEALQPQGVRSQPAALTSAQSGPDQQAADIHLGMAVPEATLSQTASRLTEEESRIIGTPPQQERVTKWLAKRYRVAGDATNMLVSAAYLTAREIKLDPLLILAVVAIESRFNPFAESPVGAQGLMQVMSKLHHEKFQELGGVKAALNPVANIRVGSLILKEYVKRGGSVEAGLKMYVGAAALETDFGYGAKVLAEYRRLKAVASGKNVPAFATEANRAPQKPRDEAAGKEKSDALTEAEATPLKKPV
jgi:soluble lytic murein transglycosylase-like protein